MKIRYFFAPIRRMFDFKGTSTRAEFFTYAIPSGFIAFLLIAAYLLEPILANMNWYVVLPREMLNDRGLLWTPLDLNTLMAYFFIAIFVTQFPMFALSVRRLNDQYAAWPSYPWVFVPFIGAVVMFFQAFVPTFVDYEVDVDGVRMMRSEQLSKRRIRNTLVGGAVLVGGAAALSNAMTVPDMKLNGGKKIKTPSRSRLFDDTGRPIKSNNILGRTKPHMRGGRSVKGYGTKRTM